MKLQSLDCPNCNASLEIENGLDTFYCKYCGYKIILSNMSDASYDAKVKIKAMEHTERMQDKKYEQERYRTSQKEQFRRNEAIRKMLPATLMVFAFIAYFIFSNSYFNNEEKKSIAQEAELQKIVEEVLVDIENGDFDKAYVKANTIYYTENWSDEIEDKWDQTRKALIKQIEKAEKEANKENSGWFN